jgi:hypothetical protein
MFTNPVTPKMLARSSDWRPNASRLSRAGRFLVCGAAHRDTVALGRVAHFGTARPPLDWISTTVYGFLLVVMALCRSNGRPAAIHDGSDAKDDKCYDRGDN